MPNEEEVTFNIIHFNDVYDAMPNPETGIGGAARFLTAIEQYGAGNPNCLVLFSGDAYGISYLGGHTEGKLMQDLLEKMHVKVAVLGNHELDYGIQILEERMRDSKFTWLHSNVELPGTSIPQTSKYHLIRHAGLLIGLIGLFGKDAAATLPLNIQNVIQVDNPSAVGAELSGELKNGPAKCDLVVALTHMGWAADRDLASTVSDIDIILGGHDHDYEIDWLGDSHTSTRAIIKSGTDFYNFSSIEVKVLKTLKGARITGLRVDKVDVQADFSLDAEIKEYLELEQRKCLLLDGTELDTESEIARKELDRRYGPSVDDDDYIFVDGGGKVSLHCRF